MSQIKVQFFTFCLLYMVTMSSFADDREVFNFSRPLDVVEMQLQNASLPSLSTEITQEGESLRRATFNAAEKPSLILTPKTGIWDWSTRSGLGIRIQNAMDWDIGIQVEFEDDEGGVLKIPVPIPAGPAQTVLIPFSETDPRAMGMRAGPSLPWVKAGVRVLVPTVAKGKFNRAKVKRVMISLDKPVAPQHILISKLELLEQDPIRENYTGLLDEFGQSTRSDWPGKITHLDQMRKSSDEEAKLIQKWLSARGNKDPYGGIDLGIKFKKSNYFRVREHEGLWYLVTPTEKAFFSLGINTVTPQVSKTYVQGREFMFRDLPPYEGSALTWYGISNHQSDQASSADRQFSQGQWFDFYAANRQRTSPDNNLDKWRTLTLNRLRAWGFNTLGGWSEGVFSGDERIPYTISLSIGGDYATIDTGNAWWGGVPDPFDAKFAMAAERTIAIATRDKADDPWLLGYFADNELAWARHGNEPEARYALALSVLKLTTDIPAKRAFLKQLRDKYRNQDGLSKAWGIQLIAWELMEDQNFTGPLPNANYPQIEEDYQQFQQNFADTYFKTINESLKWHDSNHLLLGGRFSVSSPEAIKACAKYCDVISFNLYTNEPQKGYDIQLLKDLNKPILISEFNFGSKDRGPFWPGVIEVANEEARGPAYAHFIKEAVNDPLIVGAHWFQYLDQPTSGRLLDGENGHMGLVAITDMPWMGFVDSVRKVNLSVPNWLEARNKSYQSNKAREKTSKQ